MRGCPHPDRMRDRGCPQKGPLAMDYKVLRYEAKRSGCASYWCGVTYSVRVAYRVITRTCASVGCASLSRATPEDSDARAEEVLGAAPVVEVCGSWRWNVGQCPRKVRTAALGAASSARVQRCLGVPAHAGMRDEGIVATQAFSAQAPQSLREKRLWRLGSRRNRQPSEMTAPVECTVGSTQGAFVG
jgi:hypothetical protein